MALERDQVTRYARHLLLDEVGRAGQERLLAASVRVAGTGPGSEEAAVYLAAAGVGALVVEPALADRVGRHLAAMNPDVAVRTGGEAALHLDAPEPDDRLGGALAALGVLVDLTGAAPAEGFRVAQRRIRWQRT